MSHHVYQPYPRRLYLNGEVLPDDPHATNSVVVESAVAEAEARANGYRKAYEPADSSGGNGGSPVEVPFPSPTSELMPPQTQGGVTPASADPIEDVESLRAEAKRLGLKVHHRAGAATLREAIAKAGQ